MHDCVQTRRESKLTRHTWLNKRSVHSIPEAEQWFRGTEVCYGWTMSVALSQQETELHSLVHAGTHWRMCLNGMSVCIGLSSWDKLFWECVCCLQTFCFLSLFSYLIVCTTKSGSGCICVFICLHLCVCLFGCDFGGLDRMIWTREEDKSWTSVPRGLWTSFQTAYVRIVCSLGLYVFTFLAKLY